MATHLIQIGHQRFVCGLFWQSLSRRHELRKEAIELGKKLSFDLMVLRMDRGVAAAGFANTGAGVQSGAASLGIIVAKAVAKQGAFYNGRQQPAPNWLGAFKLPDGRWAFFAVRDGSFLPNGDFVGTADEVFERLNSDYALGGWNTVIGDPEIEPMGFHNFYARRIDDLVESRRGRIHVPQWTRLRPVRRTLPWPALGFAAGVAAAAAGAWMWYAHYRAEQQIEQAREMALARARLHLNASASIAHPWARLPEPGQFAQACQRHFALLAPGGWALERYVCDPQGVQYTWSRNGSTVALLLSGAPLAQLDASGDHASFSETLEMGASRDEALLAGGSVKALLLARFQALNVPLTLSPVAPPAPTAALAPVEGAAPALPPWRQWRLQARLGGLPPEQFTPLLSAAGVRLVKLTYQAGDWSAEGIVYAN
ncbi:type 4b pilus protein PilO2 [Trinickia caryophylli]|uniref:Pilin accessory protein (PilO) n=1 Tax=Trinickia caryophylli TaxID=28094 RepID=A0A1X7EDQ7_TRICW|nr:type 4b pilus protein PilO2 [Trinickia caryophylli]PMS12874.1 pilO family protein [Trinickia caryophylli]TRX14625.1 pilO family protein [Trinickia caryophylli]WQE14469.1 type 4b pilus protein PilO2 [Trinickia caryophylli]SMF32114.1 Pilin accessory protein (PilO) [Trinickia caryophylli]GLU32128.1 PilO protein [Trinickia caryophylli]